MESKPSILSPESSQKETQTQTPKDSINLNNPISIEVNDEEKSLVEDDQQQLTTYIIKYIRNDEELKEISQETESPKARYCLFMMNLKIINSNTEDSNEKLLAFCCHEIAAIYFDEIYEKIFSLNDLWKENKYFKVFEKVEEAKNMLDSMLASNEKNNKKLFLTFENKILKLHIKLKMFDKEKEIILNIPKKNLTNEEKNKLLPDFLKEIQDKMNHLEEENKKLRNKKINMKMNYNINKNNIKYEEEEEEEERDDINNANYNTFQVSYKNDNFEKINEIDERNELSSSKREMNTLGKSKKLRRTLKKIPQTQENFF